MGLRISLLGFLESVEEVQTTLSSLTESLAKRRYQNLPKLCRAEVCLITHHEMFFDFGSSKA